MLTDIFDKPLIYFIIVAFIIDRLLFLKRISCLVCYATTLSSFSVFFTITSFPLSILDFPLHQYTQFSSVQSLSRVRLFATPWIAAYQASLSVTNSQSLPKPMCIKSVMPSSHLILCHPLLLLPLILPRLGSFPGVNSSHQVAKVLEFQLQHQSFQWTPRTDLL